MWKRSKLRVCVISVVGMVTFHFYHDAEIGAWETRFPAGIGTKIRGDWSRLITKGILDPRTVEL
jgi:hypothetical protein